LREEPNNGPQGGVDRKWWVLTSATTGLAFSQGPVLFFTFGVFVIPLTTEFGWQRGEISLALTLHMIALALALPFVGRVADRTSSRIFLLPAIFCFSLAVASLALIQNSLWILYLIFSLVGVLSSGASVSPYARTICNWFDTNRGLALGISMAGVGLGAMIMPPIAQYLVESSGWRSAYVYLGAITFIITFPTVLILMRDPPSALTAPLEKSGPRQAGLLPISSGFGSQKNDAVRTPEFWILLVVFFLVAIAINGTVVHLVPLLIDNGIDSAAAAATASVIGLSLLLGRVGAGYLLDRFFAPYVAIGFFVAAAIGIILLSGSGSADYSTLAAVCIGIGVGAEVDVMAYLVSRYFGLSNFAEIYGYQLAAFVIGSGFGPAIMGYGFDATGSYDTVSYGFVAMLAIGCLLLTRLGAFPDQIQPTQETRILA
jgi:MFS family permease